MSSEDIVVDVTLPTKLSDASSEEPDLTKVGIASELRLLSVDDATETFQIALLIHAHYRDPDHFTAKKGAPNVFKRHDDIDDWYIPQFVMVNCVDTQFEDFQLTVRTNESTGDIWASYYNTCTISESLELEKFPFDRQLFRVVFKSPNAACKKWELDVGILDFLPQTIKGKEVENEDCYLVSCELKNWRMKNFTVGQYTEDVDPASLTGGEMEIVIHAERSPRYFLINFVFLIYLIVASNFSNISIAPEDSGDRIATTITLLLTLVAFKFVLAETIPKVGYLTYMDKYVIMSYTALMVAMAENICATPRVLCFFDNGKFCGLEVSDFYVTRASDFDFNFQFLFLAVWTLIHVVVTVCSLWPNLVQDSWKDVINGQIGETEESVFRTSTIKILDADFDVNSI